VRDVVGQLKRKEIDEIVAQLPGSDRYIGKYPAALTTVEQRLSEAERVQYALTAAEWNEQVAPRDLQKKSAAGSFQVVREL
jgi:hypothetical protein